MVMTTATSNTCLNCSGHHFEEIWQLDEFPLLFGAVPAEKRDLVKRYPLSISVCQNCSLVQQTNLLSKDIINDIYEEEYYSCPSPVTSQVGSSVIDEFYSFFEETNPAKSQEDNKENVGKLLEIACFDGYLLRKLENNWDVFGCDPSGATKDVALSHFGEDRIINDFFQKENYAKGQFDVVIFRHVLEHLYDLHSFLGSISYCLKPDGCIYVEVPNVKGIFDMGSFGSFFHQHISYFSIGTIQKLLKQHHFKIVDYKESEVLRVKAVRDDNKHPQLNGIRENDLEVGMGNFYKKAQSIKEHINSIFNNPQYENIAIFSASAMATVIVDIINEESRKKIKGIYDNDSGKHGKYIVGTNVPISSPEGINSENYDLIIISSYLFFDEIYSQLCDLGIDKAKITSINGTVSDIRRE